LTAASAHLQTLGRGWFGVEPARTAYLGTDGAEEVEVDREELLDRARAGEVVVLDVRPAEEYAAGPIPGALPIPVDELAARIVELPQETGCAA
jgi:3-mercaptopyruvate sulfurtransferase SseA